MKKYPTEVGEMTQLLGKRISRNQKETERNSGRI